jgi:hypothetical protein
MTFVPSTDSRPSRLLDHVREFMPATGDLLRYSDALEVLGVDYDGPPTDVLSGIVAAVNRRLHRDGDWRLLVNVPTVGYRVATPEEARQEVLAVNRQAVRKQVRAQRGIESVIRHPDASVAERRRAADASALNANLLRLMRREHGRIRRAWPRDETSPVPPPNDLGDQTYGDDLD